MLHRMKIAPRQTLATVACALSLLGGGGGGGMASSAPDCEALAEVAARAEGIPPGLLTAIARVESGKRVGTATQAWPWTLNQGGAGSYHATRQDALDALAGALATGRTNVDVGCMQLNWRWHAAAFPDAATMIEPAANTSYAARFLRGLHDRHGDWDTAIAHYHSADPARGAAYAQKVDRVLAGLGAQTLAATVPPKAAPAQTPTAAPAQQRTAAPAQSSGRAQGLLLRPAGGLLARATGGDLRTGRAPGLIGTP